MQASTSYIMALEFSHYITKEGNYIKKMFSPEAWIEWFKENVKEPYTPEDFQAWAFMAAGLIESSVNYHAVRCAARAYGKVCQERKELKETGE